jgi:GNAT superfamily N-acetyltransferase
MNGSVVIRPMGERDVDAADRAMRLAFGTFFGVPEPASFRGDAEMIRTRWTADPGVALVAELDGRVVGSGLGADWGSIFIIGPVSVHPELWSRGIARRLMDGLIGLIAARPAVTLAGLFTHPQSTKHIRLYESYGFLPDHLTGVMSKPVAAADAADAGVLFSRLSAAERAAALAGCRAVTTAVYPGLDMSREIRAVADQRLGDTVLLRDEQGISGFAVCHFGAHSEAGSGRAYVKFAAVRPGAAQEFSVLIARCEAVAASAGAARLVAGVNSGRRAAYRLLQEHGYRADMNGVAMHRPDGPGYNRPDVFVLDDWR